MYLVLYFYQGYNGCSMQPSGHDRQSIYWAEPGCCLNIEAQDKRESGNTNIAHSLARQSPELSLACIMIVRLQGFKVHKQMQRMCTHQEGNLCGAKDATRCTTCGGLCCLQSIHLPTCCLIGFRWHITVVETNLRGDAIWCRLGCQ